MSVNRRGFLKGLLGGAGAAVGVAAVAAGTDMSTKSGHTDDADDTAKAAPLIVLKNIRPGSRIAVFALNGKAIAEGEPDSDGEFMFYSAFRGTVMIQVFHYHFIPVRMEVNLIGCFMEVHVVQLVDQAFVPVDDTYFQVQDEKLKRKVAERVEMERRIAQDHRPAHINCRCALPGQRVDSAGKLLLPGVLLHPDVPIEDSLVTEVTVDADGVQYSETLHHGALSVNGGKPMKFTAHEGEEVTIKPIGPVPTRYTDPVVLTVKRLDAMVPMSKGALRSALARKVIETDAAAAAGKALRDSIMASEKRLLKGSGGPEPKGLLASLKKRSV